MKPSAEFVGRMHLSDVGQAMLGAGLVLLVSAAVLLFSAQGELRQRNAEVQRTNTALLQIAEINSLVIGVDYSARGYALTGQKLFLDHENAKQRRLKAAVRELAGMVDADRQAAVVDLSRLVDRHAAVYSRFVTMGPGRTKEIAAIITNPVERQKRYDVLNVLERLHNAELASLYAHQALAEEQLRFTSLLTFVIVAAAFLGGTTEVMAKITRRRRNQRAAIVPAD
jgi:CHASE3 domain sensor protein